MAKVLFFLELIAVVLVIPWIPGMPPFRYSLGIVATITLIPLIGAVVVWGPSATQRACKDAFSHRPIGKSGEVSRRIFDFLSKAFPISGLLSGLVVTIGFFGTISPDGSLSSSFGLTVVGFLLFAGTWSAFLLTASRILRSVVERLSGSSVFRQGGAIDSTTAARFGLSPRETQVAELVAEGLTYREVGAKLFISPDTVKTHILRVYEKTGASNKVELIRLLEQWPPGTQGTA
jgi:DNA-binding CsgD family transcriptional regulator